MQRRTRGTTTEEASDPAKGGAQKSKDKGTSPVFRVSGSGDAAAVERGEDGEPYRATEPGTQVTISLRVPAELKARLEAVASKEHRNLSQETERRLARSFAPEALFADCLNLLGSAGTRNPMGASRYVKTMTRLVYGDRVGEIGWWLMSTLAMTRLMGGKDGIDFQIQVKKSELELVKAVISEIERKAQIITEE